MKLTLLNKAGDQLESRDLDPSSDIDDRVERAEDVVIERNGIMYGYDDTGGGEVFYREVTVVAYKPIRLEGEQATDSLYGRTIG